MSSPSLRAIVLLLCLLLTGCANLVKKLDQISKLQAALIKEYSEREVGVNLTGRRLTVTFVNSPLNDKSLDERALRAQQTAAFVAKHYSSINEVDELWVDFTKQETHFLVVHYFQGLESFGFDNQARALRPSTSESLAVERPAAVYSTALKQTDVIIRRIQLEGDTENGLSVTPHFTVPGDASGIRRATSQPKSVYFDFTSVSDKPQFQGATKVAFLIDGKPAFETVANFSSSEYQGSVGERAALPIPYPVFRELTKRENFMLRIGEREYELTREAVNALREMTDHVAE